METFKSIVDQAILIWKDSTGAARVGIILLFAICVGGITGVGIWSVQPSYEPLAGVDPNNISEAISSLKQASIDYKVDSQRIMVDRNDQYEAVAALKKAGLVTADQPDSIDLPAISSPRQERINQIRNLEFQIAHSIKKIDSVNAAFVTLSSPDQGSFARKKIAPSATVTLEVAKDGSFSEQTAATIAQMVAGAVPGLEIEKVVITDQDGKSYKHDVSFSHLSNQERHKRVNEQLLTSKAQDMLFTSLGFGNAKVHVSAAYEYINKETISEKLDKAGSVTIEESNTSKTTRNAQPDSKGTAGVSSNIQSSSSQSKGGVVSQDEIFSKIVRPGFINEKTIVKTPVLTQMTVSVLINSKNLAKDDKNQVPSEIRDKYEGIVKNAIGFDESRDKITLAFDEFSEVAMDGDVVATPIPWADIHMILKNISLGLAGLIALLIGLMAFKKLTPVNTTPDNVAVSRDGQLGQLSELVKQNPEIFSQIISAWAADDSSDSSNDVLQQQSTQAA